MKSKTPVSICTTKYHPAVKRNLRLQQAKTWTDLQIMMLGQRKQTPAQEKSTPRMTPSEIFRELKRMYSDRKQIGDRLGPGKITRGRRRTFGGDGHIHHLDCGDSFMGAYIRRTHQIVRFQHMLWIYVNYISIPMSQL